MSDYSSTGGGFVRYKCHKEVYAFKIKSIMKYTNGFTRLMAEGDSVNDSPVLVSDEWTKKHKPDIGGYYVKYEDDYYSYSPNYAFEKGYSRI